jgi:hypothetical protein
MNWLEVTRPHRICSGVRLETTVTSHWFSSNPNANCSPDSPPPSIATFLIGSLPQPGSRVPAYLSAPNWRPRLEAP